MSERKSRELGPTNVRRKRRGSEGGLDARSVPADLLISWRDERSIAKMTRVLRAIFLVSLCAFVAACASPARMENMSVEGPPVTEVPIEQTVYADAITVGLVSGGRETNPMWKSDVDNEAFKSALQKSLMNAGLLAGDGNGRYLLHATLLTLDQPFIGFDMTVTSRVSYELLEAGGQARVFFDTVEAAYTASMGSSLLGVERLRLANEGAIRENIKIFIQRLTTSSALPEN